MARALHIDIAGPQAANGSDEVQVSCNFRIGIDGSSEIVDSLPVTLALKTILGLYKTSAQLHADIIAAIVAFAYTTYSVPTNGYAVITMSGGYVLINVI